MVAMTTDMVTLKGRTDVAHIPYQPLWLLIVRGLQLLLAIIILGLSAYSGGGYYFYAGYGIGIFSFVWTLLFICYIEVSTFFYPAAYNKYIHLVLEILSVIFWLSTFASLAVVASAWSYVYTTCNYYYCSKKRAVSYDTSSYAGATKGAAALGAIEWALFIGTLITFAIYLHRQRRAEMMQPVNGGVQYGAPGVVEEHKMQPVTAQQPVDPRYQQAAYPTEPAYVQPQQPYGQQSMA